MALTTNDLSIGSTQQNSNPPINTAAPKNIPNLANYAPHAPNFRLNQSHILLSVPALVLSAILRFSIWYCSFIWYKGTALIPKHNTHTSFLS